MSLRGPISKATAEPFVWREVCIGWTLVDTPILHAIQERMPPGTFEVRHVHRHTHQLYFVLEGQASVERDGEHFTVEAGEAIEIPPDVPHQMRNESPEDIEFLVLSNAPPRNDRTNLEPTA